MRKLVLVSFAMTFCGVALAAEPDLVTKCDTNRNGKIDKSEVFNLAKNAADTVLAEFDENCDGTLDLQERSKREEIVRTKVNAYVAAFRLRQTQQARSAIPNDDAKAALGLGEPKTFQLPFLVRDAYGVDSIARSPKPREKAEGAQFSYTREKLDNNDVLSATGAVIAHKYLSLGLGKDNPWAPLGVSSILFAPAFEFDRTTNDKNPKKEVDYLAFRGIFEFEIERPGAFTALQYFRLSPYYKTDWSGDSSIWGGFAEWQPTNDRLAIGSAYRFPGTNIQFRWQPILRAEAEKVGNARFLENVTTGDSYYRVGPVLQASMWFPGSWLERLVLEAQYRYLWNFGPTGSANDVNFFQASAAYNFDEAGNYAFALTYRDGDLPGNYTRVRDIKAGLTIKY